MKPAHASGLRRKNLWYKWQVWMFVLIFGVIGSIILTSSHADTAYTVRSTVVYQSTSEGCWLAGRVWNSSTNTCTKTCRNSGSTFVAATSTRLGYCSGAVAPAVDPSACQTYARRYVHNTGCSRKVKQVVDYGALQCIYSNDTYYPDATHDLCRLNCPAGYTISTTSHVCVAPAPAPTPTTTTTTKPTTTTTAPTASTPTTTTPTKTTTTAPKPTTTKSSSSATPTTSLTGQKSSANGSVAAGTLSAKVTVPADGTLSAYILYGTAVDNMSDSTDTTSFDGASAEITLFGLQAKTKYYYQIVRNDAKGQAASSPAASFNTTGYVVSLHLITANSKPVPDIQGVINDADDTSAKSDKNGYLKFYDLDAGDYTVKYRYQNLTYSKSFSTDNAVDDETTAGKTAVLSDTVNVSMLKNGSTQPLPTKKHSIVGKILLILFIIGVGGGIAWLIIKRRTSPYAPYNNYTSYDTYNTPPAPTPVVVSTQQPAPADTPETLKVPRFKKSATVAPENTDNLEHVGESLREMVIRSMHEEAQKRKNQGQ